MRGAGAPHGDRQPGGIEHGGCVSIDEPVELGQRSWGRKCLEHGFLLASEEFGKHPIHHHSGQFDRRLLADPHSQLDRLGHRHLLGGAHSEQSGDGRVGQHLEHPVGLCPDQADLDQSVDGLRRGQLTHDVAGRRCVDHHHVPVSVAHFEAELPNGQDFSDARSCGGQEVKGPGHRTDPADDGDAELELQVLAERGLGVHRHGEEPGLDLFLLEPGGRRFVVPGELTLRVDLADQHLLAP